MTTWLHEDYLSAQIMLKPYGLKIIPILDEDGKQIGFPCYDIDDDMTWR